MSESHREQSVLGGILLANEVLPEIAAIVGPEDFTPRHRATLEAMAALADRGEGIDTLTLGAELEARGTLELAGGPEYVAALDTFVPSAASVLRYAELVREDSIRRALGSAGAAIAGLSRDRTLAASDAADRAEQLVFAVAQRRTTAGDTGTIGPLMRPLFAELEARFNRDGEITGLPSGILNLDRMTGGFQRGDLVIVGGRPSMGKTSLVMGVVSHCAMDLERPAAVFSLEMSRTSLLERMLGSEGRVDGTRIRSGQFLQHDWPKLAAAADRMFKAPIVIDDTPNLSIAELRTRARRIALRHKGLALVAVDYLQLMRGAGKGANREQEISEISRGLKALARELEVPVLALSQLNRGLERRPDKRPLMSDLRESGAIEQDADVVAFVYRDEVYDAGTADKGVAEIILGKQRNGPIGAVRVAFLAPYTRFENLVEGPRVVGWAS